MLKIITEFKNSPFLCRSYPASFLGFFLSTAIRRPFISHQYPLLAVLIGTNVDCCGYPVKLHYSLLINL